MDKIKNKMKSWAMWLSLAALVAFIVKTVVGTDISDTVSGLLDVLLPVLVGFGIVNNPNDREGF